MSPEPPINQAAMETPLTITRGHAIAFFAFDVGYEVNLENLSQVLPAQRLQPISRAKQTPTYLQYANPPRTISLGETTILPGHPGQIQATVFDFGAISVSFRWPLPADTSLDVLPAFSKRLYDANLEQAAWKQVRTLVDRIRPAIVRPALSNLIEDYFVFVLERMEHPLQTETLMNRHAATLAQVLRFETEPLSALQQRDALLKAISYYQHDLVVIDWNASLVFDADYADTLSVFELMNVELLEARYMDAELDKRIEAYQSLTLRQPRWFLPLLSPYRQTIQELAELRIEAALQAERIDNALKLIGDLYLARIHTAVSERFYIGTWDEAISRKLDIVGNLYQLLTDRISTTQGQTLELIIILLILFEIFLTLSSGLH